MGGTRVISKVFEAPDADAAVELALAESDGDWTVEFEDWRESDVEVEGVREEEPAHRQKASEPDLFA